MAHHTPSMPLSRIAAATALLCIASSVWSQTTPSQELVITSPAPQQVSGFADVPLSKAPFSGVSFDAQTLRDIGATRISDALRLDASVSDSYNSPAYWDMLSVRGYTLDNRYNYRREGLPISAETMIPMDNKERVELFKGTSGIQAGTSAPGGLANYAIKRAPTGNDDTIRSVTASYGNGKSSSITLDLGNRFGENKDFGYRFNAAYEDLNPYVRNTQGHRNLVALAMDWRITPDSKLEWEFEHSERQQMGVNGYSLWDGLSGLPPVVDGKRNITSYPNALPGVFEANTGSIRFKQNLESGWLWTTQYGAQRLRTDDRLMFAYGCGGSACDRYYANGYFDLYDWRSENERRTTEAIQTQVTGSLFLGTTEHHLDMGISRQRQSATMPPIQTNVYLGTGNINDYTIVGSQADYSGPATNTSEQTTSVFLTDHFAVSKNSTLWLGLRHSSISQNSVASDFSSSEIKNSRSINTPWAAFSYDISSTLQAYASHGQGIESEAVPGKTKYQNAGQLLPILRSRQTELGIKGGDNAIRWQLAWFDITRPQSGDQGVCDATADSCVRRIDGETHNSGLELGGSYNQGAWLLHGSGAWIQSERQNASIDSSVNGQRTLNVPNLVLRALAQYRWADVPGLRTSLRLSHEGERRVLEDGSINLPAWTTLDFAAHYDTRINGIRTEWTLAIDNLADKHYWRESPKQFGHYYLYPGAPRTGRITVRTSF